MSEIDEATVRHCAHLSRIELNDEEVNKLTRELQEILEFATRLQEVDTTGVEPMLFAVRGENVFREDQPEPSLSQEQATKNAPHSQDGFFKVPKVVD